MSHDLLNDDYLDQVRQIKFFVARHSLYRILAQAIVLQSTLSPLKYFRGPGGVGETNKKFGNMFGYLREAKIPTFAPKTA